MRWTIGIKALISRSFLLPKMRFRSCVSIVRSGLLRIFVMERMPGWRQPSSGSIPETFSESYQEDNGFRSLMLDALPSGWVPSSRPVLVVRNAMTPRLMKQSLALLLVLCLLAVGGLASAQSISHESHHAHHHKAAHATVLCNWMCAAGQVLDTVTAPALVERSPVSLLEFCAPSVCSSNFSSSPVSRGPPNPLT
jgi:hypothetical protein